MGNAGKAPAKRVPAKSASRSASRVPAGKTAKTGSRRTENNKNTEYIEVPRLKPEIKTEIWAIGLFALALLLFLAVYVSGEGVVGAAAKAFLVGLSGFGAYTLPFVVMLWGMALLLGKSKGMSLSRFLMGAMVFVIIISFIHVAGYNGPAQYGSFTEYISLYYKGGGAANGGLAGAAVGNFLMSVIGRAGACILLLAGGIVLVIVLSGKSLVNFLVRVFLFIDKEFSKYKTAGRGNEEDDDEEEDEEYSYGPERVVKSKERDKGLPSIRETYGEKKVERKGEDKRRVIDYVIGEEDEDDYEPEIYLMGGLREKPRRESAAPGKGRIVSFTREFSGEGAAEARTGDARDKLKEKLKERPSGRAEVMTEPSPVWEAFGDPEPAEPEYDVDMTADALAGLAEMGSLPATGGSAGFSVPGPGGAAVVKSAPGAGEARAGISVKGIGVEGYTPITVTTSGEDFVAAGNYKTEEHGDEGLVRLAGGARAAEAKARYEGRDEGDGRTEDDEDFVKPYVAPPVDLLTENTYVPSVGSKAQILENSKKLEDTLKSFHVEAKVVEVCKGPTVTRYELAPGVGVKVSQISKLADDLALNLAATGIRIEAPVPGKSVVGVEIPNDEVQTVFLREVVDDDAFWNFPSKLCFAVGKDIAGNTVIVDIAKMPHLLIAGATGAGKSVCINTIIASILLKSAPNEVRMLMVDPKVVELNVYNGIPHLEIPVVTDPQKAAGALSWAVREMNDRYNRFARTGTRDLKGYNATLIEAGESPLPQIIIIIDELADLMMTCKSDVEQNICRLAQKARAAGIHLIIATQRPSVDVITGLIKANVPSRLAFAVTSGIDSRTILDMVGAEKLLGKGDMLFSPAGLAKPQRIQGAFISDKEVERLVAYIKKENGEALYDPAKVEKITAPREEEDYGDGADEFMREAVDFLAEKGKASVSMLQRRFRIGYNRAARLMEELEAKGVVGPEDGVKPRKVLIPPMRWGD